MYITDEEVRQFFNGAQRTMLCKMQPILDQDVYCWVRLARYDNEHLDSLPVTFMKGGPKGFTSVLTHVENARQYGLKYDGPYRMIELSGLSLGPHGLDKGLVAWFEQKMSGDGDLRDTHVSTEVGYGNEYLLVDARRISFVLHWLHNLLDNCRVERKLSQVTDEVGRN